MILAGDVGGTKTRLGLFHASSKSMLLKRSRTLSSTVFQSLEDIVDEFLLEDETIAAACFGVAGPVVSGSAIATNLPWNVSVKSLQHKLSIGSVSIVNDLVANAYGIEGWLTSIIRSIPVKVIMNDRATLLGAAAYAARLIKDLNTHESVNCCKNEYYAR